MRAWELWGTRHPLPLLYPWKAWAKMALPCHRQGPGAGLGVAWADWSRQGPAAACPPLRRRPHRVMAPAVPPRWLSWVHRACAPRPTTCPMGMWPGPVWPLGRCKSPGAVPQGDVGGFQGLQRPPGSETALPQWPCPQLAGSGPWPGARGGCGGEGSSMAVPQRCVLGDSAGW